MRYICATALPCKSETQSINYRNSLLSNRSTHQLPSFPALVVGEEAKAFLAKPLQKYHPCRGPSISGKTGRDSKTNIDILVAGTNQEGIHKPEGTQGIGWQILPCRGGQTHCVDFPNRGTSQSLFKPYRELLNRVKGGKVLLLKSLRKGAKSTLKESLFT